MTATPRKRKQFKFWLNLVNPQEKYLADVIQWLTEQGEFVRSIRDGLRLIYDLRFQKDTQSLLELFPDIRERLQVKSVPSTNGGGQLDEIKSMLEMITAQQQSNNGYLMQSALPVTHKPLLTPPIAAVGQGKQVSADEIADNFLSMF